MAYQVIVALTTEGSTDIRFLENIVQQAFEHVSFECTKDIEIIYQTLTTTKVGLGCFANYVVEAAKEAAECGATTVAIHSDADKNSYNDRFMYNFEPAQNAVNAVKAEAPNSICDKITPIIPVRMIEAWMLADKERFCIEVGTTLSHHDLGIDGNPEQMANPKDKISLAIRIANKHASHKKPVRDINISDLYEILGQSLDVEKLKTMDSYCCFLNEIRTLYRTLGLLH
jgi:hypothetical protein